jgi:hypothetical protein
MLEESPVEQPRHPAPGTPVAQAARTVLPGEPFDPPAASQVPGPRSLPADETGAHGAAQPYGQLHEAPAGEIPVSFVGPGTPYPAASYEPAASPVFTPSQTFPASPEYSALQEFALPQQASAPPAYEPPGYEPPPAFQTPHTAQPASSVQPIEALLPPAADVGYQPPAPPTFTPSPTVGVQINHDFDAQQMNAAPQAPAPQAYVGPAGDVPPAPAATLAPPPFPAPAPGLEPVAPGPVDGAGKGADGGEGKGADGGEGKAGRRRRGPDRKLVALLAVVVVAGGGYFGYTQLHKSSSNDTSASTPVPAPKPVTPATPAAAAYDYPSNVSGFALQTGPAATQQAKQLKSFVTKQFPAFGSTVSVASYSSGKPAIVAMTYHPGRSKLASTYSTLVDNARKPAKGNVVGEFNSVAPGAAGGKMTCGGQRGASPIAYCIFQGRSVTGMVYTTGSPKTALAEIVTREMRAYAEH